MEFAILPNSKNGYDQKRVYLSLQKEKDTANSTLFNLFGIISIS